MAPERHIELDDGRVDLACFVLQGNLYAIEVPYVREIVHCQAVTPLPKAPALIEGVIDLRGAVVPVVDLGRVLGGERVKEDERARIAVVQIEGMVLGLRVESATDVMSVDANQLEARLPSRPPMPAQDLQTGAVPVGGQLDDERARLLRRDATV